ncbi:MAG: guanine-specific ribonuclease N1 and T1, partial [Acidobacteria bacterium]
MTRFASRALTAVLGSAFVVFALPGCGGGAAPAAP